MKRRGVLLVLSSPSGAGKSAIARALLKADGGLVMSVSMTTRPQRSGECCGRDYHFISDERFARMVADGDFLEHAQVFGHSYGTPKASVWEAVAGGRDVLFDVDWQGAQLLKACCGEQVASVFVLPPSFEELARRLRGRAQDGEEEVRRRLAEAPGDIRHYAEYDYVVVNDVLDTSVAEVSSILAAERLRCRRRVGLSVFIERFRSL